MEQNAKFHTAQMKAKSDKAAARGRADAARSSGMGADKGRSKAGGGGSSGGSGRGGGRGSGTNGSGGTGGGNSPKGAGKGADRSPGGGKGPSKGHQSSGGPNGRQNGSGGSGAGKSGAGKGSSGGSGGKNGSGSSGSGKGGSKDSPTASPRAERARGRQERAAARQAARQQRRSANQAANLADRSKDRDQDRAAVQAAREERRKVKAERKAAARAKREAAKAAEDRTTLGAAVGEEAQRRWDKRRAAAMDKAAKDSKAKDDAGGAKKATGDKDSEATTKKMTKDDPEKPVDGSGGDSATKEPEHGKDDKKDSEKPSDASGDTDAKPDDVKDPPDSDEDYVKARARFKERMKGFFGKAGEDRVPPESQERPRARPEDLGAFTVDRPDRPARPPQPEPADEDIEDAVIVDDPSDPFGAHVSSPASLPRAPEPHTQRPGTSRPTAQEDPVASEVNKPASGQTGMAAKHRTDITFGEYLTEIVNIAIAAALDKDRAQELAGALGKVADALRDMATDLVGDHNIATEVVDRITGLADAADRMKQLAERCSTECDIASEAARIAAMSVGRVYGEDIAAMDDAGLATASSAAHHD
ncbi:ATP/GTP-binding protein [Streptomyces sp. NPDC056132]|uniref:ATP/GTP-binding protein n=1 Tax=Streptomyces sp. NPDC056132 TaxID=3345722 RepID=UPI0035DC87F4